jgi:hypothetical protein
MKTIRMLLQLFLVIMLMTLNPCEAQNQETEKFRPDVRINVNKEYDKNNKVIRYDSSAIPILIQETSCPIRSSENSCGREKT